MEKFKHMLSVNRGTPKARIWLEGSRLTAAGFTPGRRFTLTWTPATLTLQLVADKDAPEGRAKGFGRVAGKGEKPIVDIVGGPVLETFGKHCDHVMVTFEPGVITIRRAG